MNQEKDWQRILKQKDWGKKFNLLLEYGKKYGPRETNGDVSKRNNKESKDTSKV